MKSCSQALEIMDMLGSGGAPAGLSQRAHKQGLEQDLVFSDGPRRKGSRLKGSLLDNVFRWRKKQFQPFCECTDLKTKSHVSRWPHTE